MSNSYARRPGRGPFLAEHLREDGYYELSNGHPVQLAPASPRHGSGSITGALPLASDAGVVDVGADVGHVLDEGTLRAPDLSVGTMVPTAPGFAKGAPPLAVEYADTGTDERDLQEKIAQLLAAGTRFVWVVRLVGPRRVEVYEPERPVRMASGDDELLAPGVLVNPMPAAALYDRARALDVSLRNLLRRAGYRDLDQVRDEGREEGRAAGLEAGLEAGRQEALQLVAEASLGRPLTEAERTALRGQLAKRAHTEVARALRELDGDALQRWLEG